MIDSSGSPSPWWTIAAVPSHRGERTVPSHYGSSAGELAACLRSVGLAVRSDLLARTVAGARASELRPGGAEFDHDGWRCREPAGEENTLLGRPSSRVLAAAPGRGRPAYDGAISRGGRVVLNIVGPGTRGLLADAGLIGPARDATEVPPFSAARLDGSPIQLLFQTLDNVLAVVSADDAPGAWRAFVRAGQPHQAATVGIDAIERYLLVERRRPGRAFTI